MLGDEAVVGNLSSERFARVAVEVGEREVHAVLVEHVEGRAFLQDAPQVEVEALDVGLLRGAVGIRVPDLHSAGKEFRRVVFGIGTVVLNHPGIAEFRAIVSEDRGKQLPEELRSRGFPEHVEDARTGLRGLRIAQEAEREPAFGEDHREEDLAAHGSDDGVEFARDDARVELEPFVHLEERASDAACRVRLRLRPFVAFPAPPGVGQVTAPCGEEPVLEPSVDGARRKTAERLGVGADDCGHGLPVAHGRGEDLVHLPDRLVVRTDSGTGETAERLIGGLRGAGDVELLVQGARTLPLASVADVRELREAVADRLAEVGARLEASRRVLAQGVPGRGYDALLTVIEVRTDPVRASVSPVARDSVPDELLPDGGRGPAPVLGYLIGGASAGGEEFQPVPVVNFHVFHRSFPCSF